jgi:hypothetical protein
MTKSDKGMVCDDDRECISNLGCSVTDKSVKSADNKKRDGYQGKCLAIKGSLGPTKPCVKNDECKSKYCKAEKCSDDEKPGLLQSVKNTYAAAKQVIGDAADGIKRAARGFFYSKSMPAIEKGVVNAMAEDFRTMFGVSVSHYMNKGGAENFWIHGVRNFSSFCPILFTLLTFYTYILFKYLLLSVKYFRTRTARLTSLGSTSATTSDLSEKHFTRKRLAVRRPSFSLDSHQLWSTPSRLRWTLRAKRQDFAHHRVLLFKSLCPNRGLESRPTRKPSTSDRCACPFV